MTCGTIFARVFPDQSSGASGPVSGADVTIDGSAYSVDFVTNAQEGFEDFGNATSRYLQVEMPDSDIALTAEQVRAKYWVFTDLDINLTAPRTITIPDDAATPMAWVANYTGQQLFIKTVSGSVVTKLFPIEVYQLLKPEGFPELFSGRPTIPQAYAPLDRDVTPDDITAGEVLVVQPDAFHQKVRISDPGVLLTGTTEVRWDNLGSGEIFGPDFGLQIVTNNTAQILQFKYTNNTVDVPPGEQRVIFFNNFDNAPAGELNLLPIYVEQIVDLAAQTTGSVTVHSDVSDPGSGQIITGAERAQIGTNATNNTGSVTIHSDVSDAGSGQIISVAERTQITTNDTNNTGTVTIHSDVSDAGSGAIITLAERTEHQSMWGIFGQQIEERSKVSDQSIAGTTVLVFDSVDTVSPFITANGGNTEFTLSEGQTKITADVRFRKDYDGFFGPDGEIGFYIQANVNGGGFANIAKTKRVQLLQNQASSDWKNASATATVDVGGGDTVVIRFVGVNVAGNLNVIEEGTTVNFDFRGDR